MTYITNKSFVETYMNDVENIDDVLTYIELTIKVVKKYGKKVKYGYFLDVLEQTDKTLVSFIRSFSKINKLDVNSLKSIKRLLKEKYPNYTKEFNIYSSDESIYNDIKDHLNSIENNIDANFDKMESGYGLIVQGERKSYKRTLDSDLDKLLK